MSFYNTAERNIQIVLLLLKSYGIKRVVASPGSTDIAIVSSMQHDDYFTMFSSIDERSACYMACGMAEETGEPVVIVCTGATSSRNYLPGLTEAYYRHLPVLAITCSRSNANVGHYVNQVTDRSTPPSDTVNLSVYVQTIRTAEDEWDCTMKVNKALQGLTRNGGGPCHINLETVYSRDFSVKEIKPAKVIHRYTVHDRLPEIPQGKTGIFVGAFSKWPDALTAAVERFCEKYDAVVFCDHTSNYKGKYSVLIPLLSLQADGNKNEYDIDTMIHIGYVSASVCKGRAMWRVNPDGEIRDPFKRLSAVFQMTELDFFNAYVQDFVGNETAPTQCVKYQQEYQKLFDAIPELPFSNLWIAKNLAPHIPDNAVMHFGILNSLRAWNNFTLPTSVNAYANTGGFGIDGGMSSLVGASMVNRDKIFFGFFGDLLFFYDMNSIGNRDIGNNVRILVVNNGLGQEFKNYSSFGAVFGDDTDAFIAARGHFSNRSRPVIECYAECLGFEYMAASSKEEFHRNYARFVTPEITGKPMLFEVFTETEEESEALERISTLTAKGQLAKRTKTLMNRPELTQLRRLAKKILQK